MLLGDGRLYDLGASPLGDPSVQLTWRNGPTLRSDEAAGLEAKLLLDLLALPWRAFEFDPSLNRIRENYEFL